MSDDKGKSVPAYDGYQPGLEQRGYQPVQGVPIHRPEPGAGYQPTSHGESPANVPTPPKER
jgi:hypothetical protein